MIVVNNTPFVLCVRTEVGILKLLFGINDLTSKTDGEKEKVREYITNPSATGFGHAERGELILTEQFDAMPFADFKSAVECCFDVAQLDKIESEIKNLERKKVIEKQKDYLAETLKAKKVPVGTKLEELANNK